MTRLKIGVLISGRGSNLAALAEACAQEHFPAEIAMVVSNRRDAAGLAVAREAGLAHRFVDHKGFADRQGFDAALDRIFTEAGARLICMAGFMRLLTPWFVGRWHNRLINIHPSLLPAFKGLHPQRQALAAGVAVSGCTVHVVRPEMDSGPILGQAAVPVLRDDTEASLSQRILNAEHRLYPHILRLVGQGSILIDEDRVSIAPDAAGNPAVPRMLVSP